MKREADQLITPVDDFLVAQTAGHWQGEIVLLGLVHKVQHPIQKISDFRNLSIEALGQQHGELRRINFKTPSNHGSIHALRSRCHQGMAFLHERACNQFDQMNRHNRHMPTAKDGDSSLTFIL